MTPEDRMLAENPLMERLEAMKIARTTHDCVNLPPLCNTATIGLPGKSPTAFLSGTGHDILIAEVPARQ